MVSYKFEIQNCIEVIIEGDSAEDARRKLVEDQSLYEDELCGPSCYISDGEEINVD